MPHCSVSSGISFPKSVGESESAVAPRSVSRTLIFRIAKTRSDLLVELVDDLGRRIPRCAEAPVHSRRCVRRRVTPQIFLPRGCPVMAVGKDSHPGQIGGRFFGAVGSGPAALNARSPPP